MNLETLKLSIQLLDLKTFYSPLLFSISRLAAKMSSIIGLAKEAGLNVSFDV